MVKKSAQRKKIYLFRHLQRRPDLYVGAMRILHRQTVQRRTINDVWDDQVRCKQLPQIVVRGGQREFLFELGKRTRLLQDVHFAETGPVLLVTF